MHTIWAPCGRQREQKKSYDVRDEHHGSVQPHTVGGRKAKAFIKTSDFLGTTIIIGGAL